MGHFGIVIFKKIGPYRLRDHFRHKLLCYRKYLFSTLSYEHFGPTTKNAGTSIIFAFNVGLCDTAVLHSTLSRIGLHCFRHL